MKLLTFLGTGSYSETEYVLAQQRRTSCYAPVASAQFLQPTELIVFATDDAQRTHGEPLQREAGVPTRFVPIPLGQDTAELWTIFDKVTQAVAPGETVAFDVTHGLRSFPLVGLLAAAFLRSARQVKLEAVLYGAFDVRDRTVTPNRTTLFDLSPMLALLEWAVAADRFNRTGDARYLASLVEAQRKTLALAAQGNHELLEQVGALSNLAGALTAISQSLRLIRPYRAMAQIAGLPERVQRAQPALQQAAGTLPFALALDGVVDAYSSLAQPNPESMENLPQTLSVERQMIHWCAERDLWVQAISLAREWLVSWVMVQLGMTNITQLSARQRVESVLGAEAAAWLEAHQKDQPFTSVFFLRLPEPDRVLAMWHPLTQTRNDALHAGKREQALNPTDLIAQIKEHIAVLDALPVPASISNQPLET